MARTDPRVVIRRNPELVRFAVGEAQKQGIDPTMFVALLIQESNFNPKARSSAGARGVGQFMPKTGAAYGLRTRADFEDPHKSISASARYLADIQNRYLGEGYDLRDVAAGYNYGPGRVKKWKAGRIRNLPRETRVYRRRIFDVIAPLIRPVLAKQGLVSPAGDAAVRPTERAPTPEIQQAASRPSSGAPLPPLGAPLPEEVAQPVRRVAPPVAIQEAPETPAPIPYQAPIQTAQAPPQPFYTAPEPIPAPAPVPEAPPLELIPMPVGVTASNKETGEVIQWDGATWRTMA